MKYFFFRERGIYATANATTKNLRVAGEQGVEVTKAVYEAAQNIKK